MLPLLCKGAGKGLPVINGWIAPLRLRLTYTVQSLVLSNSFFQESAQVWEVFYHSIFELIFEPTYDHTLIFLFSGEMLRMDFHSNRLEGLGHNLQRRLQRVSFGTVFADLGPLTGCTPIVWRAGAIV